MEVRTINILPDIRRQKLNSRISNTDAPVDRERYNIAVSKLSVVWAQAQRPYDPNWARLIADNFDADLFDDVVVTLPDNVTGIAHIVEGQHRVAVIDMLWGKEALVPCRVIQAHSPIEAAKIWMKINKSKKAAKPIDLFTIKVTAKVEESVKIQDILNRVGMQIGNKGRGKIAAVGAMESVYKLGPTVLERTLNVLKRAYEDHQEAYCAAFIRGFGYFIKEHGNQASLKRLGDVLRKQAPNPTGLLAQARADLSSKSLTEGVVATLILMYNRGQKKQDRLERY